MSYATGNFTVSNANVAAIADNDGDDTLRLELDSVTPNDTSLTPDVTVAQNAVQDTNGNAGPAGSSTTVTASDGAAPVALNATYRDTTDDGRVDRVDVVYSEDVSGSSYSDGDWSITSSGTVDIAKDGDGTVSGSEVRLNVTGAANTTGGSTAPTLDYSGSSVTDGPNDAPAQTLTMQDGAAPTFAGLTTVDADSNGTVDTLNVTFTESVASGSVEAADFSIDSANGLSGTVSGVADDDGDAAVNLTLNEGSSADTGATPTLAYTQSGGSSAAVQDAAGNQMIDTTSDAATDSAAPVVLSSASLDRNGDGTVDSVGVQYSENVSASSPEIGDYSLGGSDSGAIMFDSSLVSDDTVYLSTIAPQNDTGLDLALSYDASAGTQGSITDGSNPAASFSGETVLDRADPRMVSVTTNDTNRNGTVDALTVTFTEPVNDSSVDAGDFSSPAGSVDGVTTGTADDNRTTLSVSGLSAGTAVTPDVTLAGDSLLDLSGNDNPSQTLTATDTASPAVTAASTADTNGDGSVDRIDLTLSEAIDDDASTLAASAFSLSDGAVDSVSTGTANDDAVSLSVSGLSGSDATPDVTYAGGTFLDSLGNALSGSATFTNTTSGAAPTVESATVLDRDGDGNVDAANVTFTGAIDDATVSPGDWTIGGTTVDSVDTLGTTDDDRLQLRITTDAAEVNGTGTADVTYTPGSTADLAGNEIAAVDAGDVDEVDGSTPVVTDVSATGDERVQVEVTATESLDSVEVDLSGPESTTLSSFAVSGDGPYVHTLTYAPDTEGEYTATLQTAADAAGNDGAGGEQDSVSISFPDSGGSSAPSAPGSFSSRVASSTVTVFGGTGSVTFDLGSGPVDSVEVSSDASGNGFARATTLSSLPDGVSSPDDPTVGVVSIQMPDDWATTPATLRMRVDTSATDVDPERLRVAHYDESTDSWDTFETDVESQQGSTAVLTAETPGFSTFAVVQSDPAATETVEVTTATATPTPDSSDGSSAGTTAAADGPESTTETGTASSTTSGSGPGFGVVAVVLALVAVVAVVRRRR